MAGGAELSLMVLLSYDARVEMKSKTFALQHLDFKFTCATVNNNDTINLLSVRGVG